MISSRFLKGLRRALGLAPLLVALAACNPTAQGTADAADLPPEATTTLALIRAGGPFPYRKDGSVFQNRERMLPEKPRGYYREYTVPTPGSPDRGARRIVTGGEPPEIYYYTGDHYRSFRRISPRP
ncbi:ribonuclease [Azoarcus sp. L1K30]|uniref:ribonuclease domain-containing protein n=1 Tax=Azoarcus sp. L1K30 TaxID=2820277 RepID=UPI001B844459|nr:ribonuclease domain-containing protein [Azoarcus sp. L1K30]MBR0568608.1 ribonuclease [Azoarcus sp. L1K30]